MAFSSWMRNPSSKRAPRRPAQHRPAAARFRPQFEALEDRTVPSGGPTILKVTSLGDSGKGTLRDAILQVDKNAAKTYEIDITVVGTILLESSLPDLASPISLVGLGTGQTLIQRDTLAVPFRLLTVDASQTAALSGLTMAQGYAGSGVGGAIDNLGILTLTNCALSGNTASAGGAVANEAVATLTVSGSSFAGNSASNTGSGGAIWNNGTQLTVQANSTFTCNTAAGFGGAIFNATTATVSQTTFTTNSAGNGGALENVSGASLTVNPGTSLMGNSAGTGGAIRSLGTLAVSGATFTNNTAVDGGAIITFGGATVSGGSFSGNKSTGTGTFDGGGAIWNDGTLTVQGSSLSGNTAAYGGGAIEDFATATLTQATFTTNSAQFGGAIISWLSTSLTVNFGTSFTGNTAGNSGGAIYTIGTLAASGATFTNNMAVFGGAIINGGGATVSGCTFIDNHTAPGGSGGAIYFSGGTLAVQNYSSFSGNTAGLDGGAIFNLATANVVQSTFATNSAQYGGAITNDGTLTVQGSSLSGNTASGSGGAIFNFTAASVTQSSFATNVAQSGGAIMNYYASASFTLDADTLTGNTASGSGGAVWNYGTLTVQVNSTFSGNSAGNGGGAIANAATATVTQTAFTSAFSTPGNSAQYGGSIWNVGGANLTLNLGTSFTGNSATVSGGATGARLVLPSQRRPPRPARPRGRRPPGGLQPGRALADFRATACRPPPLGRRLAAPGRRLAGPGGAAVGVGR
jgi:predicted outer membrane repeat protein